MKTLIAIPCTDLLHTAFVQSLMQADLKPLGEISLRFQKNTLVYDGRNLLAIDAITSGYDQVLWLDSDITFPPDMPAKLTYAMSKANVGMATGIYVNRHSHPHPILYKKIAPPEKQSNGTFTKQVETYEDIPNDSIFPVAGAGFGCVLIRTSLLKEVFDKYGPPFTPLPWASEDISFCYRVGLLGQHIVATSQIRLGHVGQYEYTVDDLEQEE